MFHCRADQRTETMKEGEISSEPAQPPPPPDGLHLDLLRGGRGASGEPVVGRGGEVAEMVFKGRVVSDTEEKEEQEAEGEVCEEQEAVSGQKYVEEILLHSDHL